MVEVASAPTDEWWRNHQRVESIERVVRQVNYLQATLRLEINALIRHETPGGFRKFVGDHLALTLGESSVTMDRWVTESQIFAEYPAVVALVADGHWSIRHADALLSEILGTLLSAEQQAQVVQLVADSCQARTPYQIRRATRAAVLLLDPEAAERRYDKVVKDRQTHCADNPDGSGTFWANGPKHLIAQIHACLDTICLPKQPGDTRTLAQRRFDTLLDLICGRAQPGQWQQYVMIRLNALDGEDGQAVTDQDGQPAVAGEIPGLGLITAAEVRDINRTADLRRAVVDDHEQLISLDSHVQTPDASPAPAAAVAERLVSDAVEPLLEQDRLLEEALAADPEPTAAERAWLHEQAELDEQIARESSWLETELTAFLARQPALVLTGASAAGTGVIGAGVVGGDHVSWPILPTEITSWYPHHGPDERPPQPPYGPSPYDPDPEAGPEPEPPSREDLDWYSWAAPHNPLHGPIAYREPAPPDLPPTPPVSNWSRAGLRKALDRLLTLPVDRRPLESSAYELPPRLARFIKTRDLTCTFPGCQLLARNCQNDHIIEWSKGGLTNEHNTSSECTHHHQAKHAFFTVTRLEDGTLRWTSPNGRSVDRHPRPFLRGW